MVNGNETFVTKFIFLGLSRHPKIQVILFVVFLACYLLILFGNIIIIIISVVKADPQLHMPMYFFLINLSFLDVSYISTNVPQMLVNLVTGRKTVTFWSCAIQMYFSLVFGMMEYFWLGVMSYDHYVAICQPLHYTVIISWKICVQLAVFCWGSSFMSSLIINIFVLQLPFCGLNILNIISVKSLLCYLAEMLAYLAMLSC